MARRIAVIDYGTGNLKSVVKAFEHLGASVSLIRKPEDVGEIDAIVFPGQGSYDQCMNCLMQSGLDLLLKIGYRTIVHFLEYVWAFKFSSTLQRKGNYQGWVYSRAMFDVSPLPLN